MSRLSEMIREMCPDGVEYRKLGEILSRHKGIAITAGRMKELHTPNGEIRIFAAGNTYADVMESDVDRDGIIREPAIIVKSRGNIGFEYYTKPFSHKNEMWSYTTNHAFISLKYVYYVLEQNMAYFQNKAKTGKLPQISISDTENYEIPVPPLLIQNEIVKLLDNFTELTAELTAELLLRKKQYNFYRDALLTFAPADDTIVQTDRQTDRQAQRIGKIDLLKESVEVEWKTLQNIATSIFSGNNKNKSLSGTYPVYGSTDIIGWTTQGRYSKKNILVARVGVYAGFVQFVDGCYDVSDNTLVVDVSDEVNIKYIFYYLKHMNLNHLARGGGQPLITAGQLKKLNIPIPPLEVQQKIVSILDRFDTLCNDLTQGLPAEIAARRKQYAYYRDKLLTFPKSKPAGRS